MGLAPIGCTPHYLWEYKSVNGECVDAINNVVVNFNYAMRYMVDELNRNLSDAMIIFYDAFEGSMDILANRRRYGEAQSLPFRFVHFFFLVKPCLNSLMKRRNELGQVLT